MSRQRHLLRSSLLVIAFFAMSKVTGFLKLILITDVFGAGKAADALTAAGQLPELFQVMVAGGALAASLIPIYSQQLNSQNRQQALKLAQTVMTLVIITLGILCAIGAWQAPWLVRHLLVPDFSGDQQALTAQLMRIFLAGTTILGISGVLSSILNAHQHFLLPALATVVIDLGYLAGLLWLVPLLGVAGAAWGAVVGALLHLAVQLPAAHKYRLAFMPRLNWRSPATRDVLRLLGPRVVTMALVQAADLYIIRLASMLPAGSVSAYFYAYLFMQVPLSLFGFAIALVIFPTLAAQHNSGDIDGLRRTGTTALRVVWALTFPAATGLVLLGQPGVAFVFQRGAFDVAASVVVYSTLVAFSLRIVAEGSLEIVSRMFYARHNTTGPMLAYIGWFVMSLVGSVILVQRLGLPGLALASSIAFTAAAIGLYGLYRQLYEPLSEKRLGSALGRILLATSLMSSCVWLARQIPMPGSLTVPVAAGTGVIVYVSAYACLNPRELSRAVVYLFRSDVAKRP